MGRSDDDRPAERSGGESASGVASGRSLDSAGSGESLAADSRGGTAGFADGDEVPVRPAADRTGLAGLLTPSAGVDAGVVGGHQAVAVGDRQGCGACGWSGAGTGEAAAGAPVPRTSAMQAISDGPRLWLFLIPVLEKFS